MEVTLTRGFVAQIDDADAELVQQYAPWSAGEFGRPGLWYAFTNVKTERGWRVLYMHRLVTNAPPRQPVDHIDDDGLNNRRSNLQLIGNGPNIAKGRRPERKATRPVGPKETTKRRSAYRVPVRTEKTDYATNAVGLG